jgi:hypothetical protein
LIIAFVIQLPFLFLMSRVGVHSALGGAWVFFYLPAIWILDKMRVPDISPWVTMLLAALVQQIILLIIILPLMALWARLKTRQSTSV